MLGHLNSLLINVVTHIAADVVIDVILHTIG